MAPERAVTDSLSGLDQPPTLPVRYLAAGLFRTQFSKHKLSSLSVAALMQEAVGDAKEGVSLYHGRRMSDQGPFQLVTASIFLNNVLVGQVTVGDFQTDLEHRHRQVLENYLQIFVVLTLAILVFSVRLVTNISAPISSLAAAVEASGTTEWENEAKPCALILDLSQRSDEIDRLSAALRGMVAALYDRIDANEQFAGEVAHEIKNPLASLRAAVGAFAIANSGPERQQLLNVIDHDVLRIDRLVNDISTASKLDSDFLKDQESKFELVADLSEKSIKVVGLEDRLAQVIMNLITNAISFCGAGDAIRIWVRQCDNRVLIVVEDMGPGLSDGSLQKYLTGFTLIGPPAILAITQVLGLLFPNRLSTLTVG